MSLTCGASGAFEGQYMGARIASVFVLLILSAVGSFFPLLAVHYKAFRIPNVVIFITRYFGSGVIVATAFIHLLGESQDSFSNPCVSDMFDGYSWSSALALMGTTVMFTIEAFTHRRLDRRNRKPLLGCGSGDVENFQIPGNMKGSDNREFVGEVCAEDSNNCECDDLADSISESMSTNGSNKEGMVKTLMSIYLLEFGIVFHSLFVGLSLAISGDEFKTLFVAICFHQFFEGMGLGSRFATAEWPDHLRRIPWYLSAIYSLTTPIGIAIGLGVRHLYLEDSPTSLIVVGVFDGFCSGLLIYNSLVELMARDFVSDSLMRKASDSRFVLAYVTFLLGGLLMALLGRWV